MQNTSEKAARWTELVASQSTFPCGARLRAAFEEGEITYLCNCGCNAFDLKLPTDPKVAPLVGPGAAGMVFEIAFKAHDPTDSDVGSLELLVMVDTRGHFAGLDVGCNGNTSPVSDSLTLLEAYHVYCSESLGA